MRCDISPLSITAHAAIDITNLRTVYMRVNVLQVKAVSSLSITCQSPVRASSDKLHTFPLGMNVVFAVTLHDNIGRAFVVSSIPLKYRLNRQVATK